MKYRVKKEVKKSIVNFFLNIAILFLGVILLVAIYNFFQTKILGNQYSSFFGYTLLEVQTGSMEPTISPGDWIITKNKTNYEYDQVISFINSDQEVITHRIKTVLNDEITTKGDANPKEDNEKITSDQVIGEVVSTIPFFGLIKSTILNPVVIILMIIVFYIFTVILKGEEKEMFSKIKSLINKLIPSNKEDKILDSLGDDFMEEDKLEEKKENITKVEEQVEDYSNTVYLDEEDLLEDNKTVESRTQEQIDEDLSKTTFFRIISVEEDDSDIQTVELDDEEFEDMEELEKSSSVEDLPLSHETIEEITEEEDEVEEKTTEEIVEEKIALEEIFNKTENKRCKGVISKLMAIKEEEINQIIDEIHKDYKLKQNEPSIKKALIKSYIESKYYNIFSKSVAELDRRTSTSKFNYVLDNNSDIINEKNGFKKALKERAKKVIIRIGNALEEDSQKLSKNHSGTDKYYDYKLEKYAMLMMMISKLEYLETTSKDLKGKKHLYAKELIKFASDYEIEFDNIDELCKNIINIQKKHNRINKFFLNRLKTEVFELVYSEIKSKKGKYIVNIKHNINFSQVYSNEIINKAYQEGIVAEDKLNVLMTLLQARLGKDMLQGDFMNEYIVTIPNSLSDKEKKLERYFNNNDDEYAKKNVIYLISYDEFMKVSKIIKELRKKGYRISCYIDNKTKFISKNKTSMALAEYIFIDKKVKTVPIDNVVLDNFKDRIIKDDFEKKLKTVGDGE